MKISNSKKELARIISENGGWIDGAASAAQSKSDSEVSFYRDTPFRSGDKWCGDYIQHCDIKKDNLIYNWHQTILSREEYFHIYPAPDSEGWIEYDGKGSPYSNDVTVEAKWTDGDFTCSDNFGPGPAWIVDENAPNITHHRLHNPEQFKPEFCESVMRSIPEPTVTPTLDQLLQDWRNADDYAQRKQTEADEAAAMRDERWQAVQARAGEMSVTIRENIK